MPRLSDSQARMLKVIGVSVGSQAVAWGILWLVLGVWNVFYPFFDYSDTWRYFKYATWIAEGRIPFIDWNIEYPPLAVPLFSIPGHLQSLGTYRTWFAIEMVLISMVAGACTAAVAALLEPKGDRPYLVAVLYSAGVVTIGAVVANRYDVAIALVLAVMLLLLVRGNIAWAAFVLGVGFALKLTPVILLPLVLVLCTDVRAAVRSVVAFGLSALLPFAVVIAGGGFDGLIYMFDYHLSRPLEIETLWASPFMIGISGGWLRGTIETQFGSQVLIAKGAETAAFLAGPATVIGLGIVYWLIWRRRELLRQTPKLVPLAVLTVVLVFITFGKVLSPQYVIWLLPLAALVAVYRPALGILLFVTFLLTHVLFPANYTAFMNFFIVPAIIAAIRNLLLVVVSALAVWELWKLPDAAPKATQIADA